MKYTRRSWKTRHSCLFCEHNGMLRPDTAHWASGCRTRECGTGLSCIRGIFSPPLVPAIQAHKAFPIEEKGETEQEEGQERNRQ